MIATDSATDNTPARGRPRRLVSLARICGFPVLVIALYGILMVAAPDRGMVALVASGRILLQVALPLGVAFVMMFLLNLLVKPAHISRLAGRGAGVTGILLSTTAGIFSMGPMYVWYPLLGSLREKGASDFHLANFLSNRAVKPFLMPLMVFYFGWVFTLALTVLTVIGAQAVAAVVVLVTSGGRRGARQETR